MNDLQLFGATQISSSVPPTMADISGLGSGFASETASAPNGADVPDAPADVQSTEDAPPANFLQLDDTGDMQLEPGMQMRGEVVETEGNNVTLQFGDTTMTATTQAPLQEGQHVNVQVTDQQNGKWTLQLTGSELTTQMSSEDVTSALMDMNVPPSESNVEVAKTMVAMGLPLRGEDLQELVQNLAQLPRDATPEDLKSAVFLKAASLPMTTSNLMTLANFITEHPFIGAQLVSLQSAFRRLLKDGSSTNSMSTALLEMLEEAPGMLGEMVLDPLQSSARKMQENLQNMAFQAGIESMGPHVGDDFDMQEWLQSLRDQIFSQSAVTAEMGTLAGLLGDLSEHLDATRLMNASAAAQGSFYFQIPMKPSGQTAESKLLYHVDSQGRTVVDSDNTVIELLIPTANLGNVAWQISIVGGFVTLDAAVETESGRAAIHEQLPALMSRLEALGYRVGMPTCRPRAKTEQVALPPIQTHTFEKLERVNIQA